MGKELSKEEFISKLKNRGNTYLYKVGVIATANDNYINYAYEYIMSNEIDGNNLKNIAEISRETNKKNYNVKHKGKKSTSTNRQEEGFVLDLFYKNTDKSHIFGDLKGYQIPLKDTNNDKGIGKIDFAFIKDNNFMIAEIKAEYSTESLLKAILEIQTYYQTVNKEKLLSDFNCYNMQVGKCIVIFNGTKAHKQFQENDKIQKLIKLFNIDVMVLDNKNSFTKIN